MDAYFKVRESSTDVFLPASSSSPLPHPVSSCLPPTVLWKDPPADIESLSPLVPESPVRTPSAGRYRHGVGSFYAVSSMVFLKWSVDGSCCPQAKERTAVPAGLQADCCVGEGPLWEGKPGFLVLPASNKSHHKKMILYFINGIRRNEALCPPWFKVFIAEPC